jgi:hypothetical protein
MALYAGSAKLTLGIKTLRARWEEVKQRWNDPVRQGFEKDYWDLLEDLIRQSLRGIDHLGQQLDEAKHDCE